MSWFSWGHQPLLSFFDIKVHSSLHWTVYTSKCSGPVCCVWRRSFLVPQMFLPCMERQHFSATFSVPLCLVFQYFFFPSLLGWLDKGPVWVSALLKCCLGVFVFLFFCFSLCLSGYILSQMALNTDDGQFASPVSPTLCPFFTQNTLGCFSKLFFSSLLLFIWKWQFS